MNKEEAIKYLQQLYPNGEHCWLDEQRIEAISMAINALQEDPVSEDLEAELDKYIKDNFTIDKEQLNRFGIEEKDYMYSMDKSDMFKMIRHFTNNYKVPASNDLEEAAKLCVSDFLCITNEEDWDDAAVDALNIFKASAQWQKEQFEKNRLAHCDTQTEEEAEIESDFVMGIIENEHRQPTFDDAIKYGMRLQKKQMMAKAVDGVVAFDYYGDDDKTYGCIAHDSFCLEDFGLKDMDKVKMILIKEIEL